VLTQHPANLILRFVLEVAALIAIGQWGWQTGQGLNRYLLAFGLPLLLAAIWAVFRTPDDPSSGKGVVAIPGRARLALEILFFGFAVWTMFASNRAFFGIVFLVALLLHYMWSLNRVAWLMRER
jgi:hypothetical protein